MERGSCRAGSTCPREVSSKPGPDQGSQQQGRQARVAVPVAETERGDRIPEKGI